MREHEAALEELQSTNEEALSSNEELQSVNEELQTAKEEIQSANEELATLNQELQDRNVQLGRSNDEIQRALDSANALVDTVRQPLVILDGELRVEKANVAFYETFQAAAGADSRAGCCRSWAAASGTDPGLLAALKEVLASDTTVEDLEVEAEFPGIGSRTMSLNARRLHPERGTRGRILLAIEDRTEVKRAERGREALLALEHDARERAEAADHLKDEFVATVSHELRGPLTVISGWMNILLGAGQSPDTATLAKALAAIGRGVTAQGRLISDLLDHSRLVTGKVELQRATHRPADGRGGRPGGRAGGGRGQGHRPRAVGRSRDEHRARRFRPHAAGAVEPVLQRGQVHAARRARPDLGRARRQPGPRHRERHRPWHLRGVPAPRLRALPPGRGLEQPNPARARPGAHPGARAGRAARRNGPRGEPGQGPGRHLHGRPSHPGPAAAAADVGAAISSSPPPADSSLRRTRPHDLLDGTSVLVVDDEADARDALVGLLERYGAHVRPAASVAEAMAALETDLPDVLISDLGMPGEDGYELIRRVRLLPADGGRPASVARGQRVCDGRAPQEGDADRLPEAPREAGGSRRAGDRGGTPGRPPEWRHHYSLNTPVMPAPAAASHDMEELRAQFVQRSEARIEMAARLLARLRETPAERQPLQELMRFFHSLAGVGTSFGFPQVTALAKEGELECLAFLHGEGAPSTTEVENWSSLLGALAHALSQPPAAVASAGPMAKRAPELLLVSSDTAVRETLVPLLNQEGHSTRLLATRAEAAQALGSSLPDALIVDAVLDDGSGYDVVDQLRGLAGGESVPVLVLSPRSGFLDRLEAIHGGADGYFDKPVDGKALLRRLQHLLEASRTQPARILSVEDDPHQAAYLKSILESGGHEVAVCEEPKRFEAAFREFQPDLVVMDILLPDISGYDLVRYLRQDERQATLPGAVPDHRGPVPVALP